MDKKKHNNERYHIRFKRENFTKKPFMILLSFTAISFIFLLIINSLFAEEEFYILLLLVANILAISDIILLIIYNINTKRLPGNISMRENNLCIDNKTYRNLDIQSIKLTSIHAKPFLYLKNRYLLITDKSGNKNKYWLGAIETLNQEEYTILFNKIKANYGQCFNES